MTRVFAPWSDWEWGSSAFNACNLLSSRIIPSWGADTEFADMRAAYDALDQRTKAEVADLICGHSLVYSREAIGFVDLTPEEAAAFAPVRHPLVRRHPITGRTSLFLSAHAGTIVGWTIPEARLFLRDLTEHATQRAFVYSHSWKPHDLVMWDNRTTMHRARQFLSPTPLVWHNGGTPGSKAVAAFTPGGDLGVVILSNLDGTELPEALMYYLYDLYYGRPEKDHTEAFLKDAKARVDAAKFPAPPARPAPTRALGAYAGTYQNPYFGPLIAEVQDGRVQLRMGSRQALVRTKHWDGDTFAISVPGYGTPTYTDGFVSFQFGPGDTAIDLRFLRVFDDAGDGRFVRTPDK